MRRNFRAVDDTLARLFEVAVPEAATSRFERRADCAASTHRLFVREVTAAMMEGRGDEIPVSRLPVDGTWPSGTAIWEKRNIADAGSRCGTPILCVQCGQCSFVCPHGVIQAKYFDAAKLDSAPASFRSAPINVRGFPDVRFTLAVRDRGLHRLRPVRRGLSRCQSKSLPMQESDQFARQDAVLAVENRLLLQRLPMNDRARVDFANVRGVQFFEPLFDFSGACAGCGETPYLKLLSQLFGDRLQIANATGCSSIYGGNLPVTPWSTNQRRSRTRLVELAVRGQRRIRSWLSLWPPTSTWRWRQCLAREIGADTRSGSCRVPILNAPQLREFEIRRSTRVSAH